MLLAAGEALLAVHNPGSIYQGTGIYSSLLLVLLAGLIISVVMLRSSMRSSMRSSVRSNGIFSRTTGYVGILANASGLGYFVLLVFAPALVAVPFVISGPFRVLWYILIALGLLRLARGEFGAKG